MNTLDRWVVIFLLFVLVIAWNSLVGCAQLPLCEKFAVHPATGPGGEPVYWMTEENLEKLMILVDGLHRGNCRLEE